jgi:hypothetical protein
VTVRRGEGEWHARSLTSPSDLPESPICIQMRQAQEWCNFVLWNPVWLPPDCSVGVGTLRYEAPPGRPDLSGMARVPWSEANPSSYRLEIVGRNRALRIKQFLYDWAFPALDQPNLWGGHTTPVPVDDRYILWIGSDYLGNQGAALRRARTSIEFSVTSGSFAADELAALAGSIRPESASAALAIGRTPLAVLSYWARYPVASVRAPIGLWVDAPPSASPVTTAWTAEPRAMRLLQRGSGAPNRLGGFTADTGISHRSAEGHLRWVEIVYSGGTDRGHELRLLRYFSRSDIAPKLGGHPGSISTRQILQQTVYLACVNERYGPWDAIWQDPVTGQVTRLLNTSGCQLAYRWFIDAVTQSIKARPERPAT